MIELTVMVLMGVFALLAIHAKLLRLAVIYLAIFSLLAAFLYLLYAAPELAIAEGVIGSGLVTLLYLSALKRYRVYTIGVLPERKDHGLSDEYISAVEDSAVLSEIKQFFMRREFEPQLVFVTRSLEEALANPNFDVVVKQSGDAAIVYGPNDSYAIVELELMFQMHGYGSSVEFVRYAREEATREEAK